MAAIKLEAVTLRRDGKTVLDGLDLHLQEMRIGVIGHNGSGKSSFLRLLNGLLTPQQGSVTVDGLDGRRDVLALRQRVGFVFQEPELQLVMPSVDEELRFGLDNLRIPEFDQDRRIERLYTRFGIAHWKDRPCHALSAGEKQLLALCSVLVMEPQVLLLDEPMTRLDLMQRARLSRLLQGLPQQQIEVCHELESLTRFERVLVFEQGRVVFDGPASAAECFYRSRVDETLAADASVAAGGAPC